MRAMKILICIVFLSCFCKGNEDEIKSIPSWDASKSTSFVVESNSRILEWNSNNVGTRLLPSNRDLPEFIASPRGINGHNSASFHSTGLQTSQVSMLGPYYLALLFQSKGDGTVISQTWSTGSSKMFSVAVRSSRLEIHAYDTLISNKIHLGDNPVLVTLSMDIFSWKCTLRVNGTFVTQVHVNSQAVYEDAPLIIGGYAHHSSGSIADWTGMIGLLSWYNWPIKSADISRVEEEIMAAWFSRHLTMEENPVVNNIEKTDLPSKGTFVPVAVQVLLGCICIALLGTGISIYYIRNRKRSYEPIL